MPRRTTTSSTQSALLELTPRTAKLVIVSSANPVRIDRLIAQALPAAQEEDPVAALQALLSAHPLSANQVGVVIGRELFSLQALELPSSNRQEIASMLELQLGKLTPYPRAEILAASMIVGSFREGYTSVVLAITRKPLIEGILRVLRSKGLEPRWVGVSSEGLVQWWLKIGQNTGGLTAEPNKLLALIDVDATSTDCALLSQGELVFSHSIAIGQEQLAGADQANTRWVGELARLPRILLHEDLKGHIGRGVVCGSAEALRELAQQLASFWNVPVETVNPLSTIEMPQATRQTLTNQPSSFTALVGWAAHGQAPRLDLIPQETRVYQALQVRARSLARLAASVAAVIVLVAVLYVERMVMLQRYLAQLDQRLSKVEQQGLVISRMERAMRKIQPWLNPTHGPLEILRGVSESVEAQITVTQLSFQEDKPVAVKGKAQTTAAAFAFFERLDKTGLFSSVQSKSVAKAKGAQATGAEFEVLCTLKGS